MPVLVSLSFTQVICDVIRFSSGLQRNAILQRHHHHQYHHCVDVVASVLVRDQPPLCCPLSDGVLPILGQVVSPLSRRSSPRSFPFVGFPSLSYTISPVISCPAQVHFRVLTCSITSSTPHSSINHDVIVPRSSTSHNSIGFDTTGSRLSTTRRS